MLAAAGQAFQELFTPPFRAVLWKCVGFTIGLLVVLIIGVEWTFSHFVQWPGWIEKTIESARRPRAGGRVDLSDLRPSPR